MAPSAIDRTSDARLPLTQEQLAAMLGVGRSYVSRVIQSLKARKIIETRRGGLTVADLQGLSAILRLPGLRPASLRRSAEGRLSGRRITLSCRLRLRPTLAANVVELQVAAGEMAHRRIPHGRPILSGHEAS
jgi:DNA-binding FadR family transcriptional regulator